MNPLMNPMPTLPMFPTNKKFGSEIECMDQGKFAGMRKLAAVMALFAKSP